MGIERFTLLAGGLTALMSLPASAATPAEEVALCAAAADAEGLAPASGYRPKFIDSRGGALKRVTIELVPYDRGDVLTAECRIRRGEVVEVALKA